MSPVHIALLSLASVLGGAALAELIPPYPIGSIAMFWVRPGRGSVLKVLLLIRSGLRAGRRKRFEYDLSPIGKRSATPKLF